MSKIQLLYKEDYKGWVSFLTYYPTLYATLGNKFFTVHNGQIWEHNDLKNPDRNNIYGVQLQAKINFFVNIENNEEVVFKTVMLEGNDAWDLTLQTNYTQGELLKTEFNKRESNYYAHFRQNEVADDLSGLKTSGIGILLDFQNDQFLFDYIPDEICVGDQLYSNDNTTNVLVGTVSEVGPNYIEVESVLGAVVIGHFYFSMKDSRTEGGDLRGYYAEITMTNDNQSSVELFAVNTNIAKSYV